MKPNKKFSKKHHQDHNNTHEQTQQHDYWKDHNKTLPNKLSAGSQNIARMIKTRGVGDSQNQVNAHHHKPGQGTKKGK